jgi:cytochrome P450
MATERYAREDVTIAGVTIPRGEMVFAVIASANRDERQFANPDALDLTREPNKHLAFGLGMHFCLGASLARLEEQIAINTLLRHVPELRLTVAPEAWNDFTRSGSTAGGLRQVASTSSGRFRGSGLQRLIVRPAFALTATHHALTT